MQTFNPSLPEAKAGVSELETSLVYIVPGHPGICREIVVSNEKSKEQQREPETSEPASAEPSRKEWSQDWKCRENNKGAHISWRWGSEVPAVILVFTSGFPPPVPLYCSDKYAVNLC